MKIYLKPHRDTFCLRRIRDALVRYAPDWVDVTEEYSEADLVVMYITGRRNHRTLEGENLLKEGRKYAVAQLVLGSCRNPDPADWMQLWAGSEFVWSYYKLEGDFNFYHAPLAAEPEVFYKEDVEKKYVIGSTGVYWTNECIGELQHALWYLKRGRGIHVGANFNNNPIVEYTENISDDEMRAVYNSCEWFSCLRRKDGFEMPAVESLLCGVRPIMFDTPNYRQWFDGLAHFIPEKSAWKVTDDLWKTMRKGADLVSDEEIQETKNRFDWSKIVEGFYARIIHPDPSTQ